MKPILYSPGETDFSHYGIGVLTDATACTVEEERNGKYELTLMYPVGGAWYEQIVVDALIKAKPNEMSEPQLFRIYSISAPISQIVTVYAEHISYALGRNVAMGFTFTGNAHGAINALLEKAVAPHRFVGESDITDSRTTSIQEPTSVRACLGGTEGSILDTWHGEYEWDNFRVVLHAARGRKTDAVVEYGKNLTDVTQEKNISEMFTAVLPYAKAKNGGAEYTLYLPEKYIEGPTANKFADPRIEIKDFTDKFGEGEAVTEEALREKATEYVQSSGFGIPKVNITMSMVQLWQTAGMEQYQQLERVGLCDTITVRYSALGVDATAKVIRTVYDVLLDRYETLELGDAKSRLDETIGDIQNQVAETKKQYESVGSVIADEVKHATDLITGVDGGHVLVGLDAERKPQEILILDTESTETAKDVWRWNLNGFGHSSTGVNGPYDTAITMDGHIVGKFITALVITGAQIQTGRIQMVNGKSHMDLDTATIDMAGTIGNIKSKVLLDGHGLTVELENGWAASLSFGLDTSDGQYKPRLQAGSFTLQVSKNSFATVIYSNGDRAVVNGELHSTTGYSGTFSTGSRSVTVSDGIITGVS